MNINNTPLNTKKIPYYLAVFLLVTGAVLILGFLSFGGMYAILPILPLAFAAFGLSVAYEGQVYLQNIKGTLNKLFKNNYLKNHLAKKYLLEKFPEKTEDENCPQFFKDYEIQLKLLATFEHKNLTARDKKRKKQLKKTLGDMEKWFALQLFPQKKNQSKEKESQSEYAKELQAWLADNSQKKWQTQFDKRQVTFHVIKAFSVVSALFMGLGSTYLIVEAFSVIPFFAVIPFAFWPAIIVPMAIIAGVAYGMLTYNAATDLINNDTVVKWYHKIRNNLNNGWTIRNVLMATTASLLVLIAIALTICTAGTWWTIASNARPLFVWMTKMPKIIMGVINPVIAGLSTLIFVIENTGESLDLVYEVIYSKNNIFQRLYDYLADGLKRLRATENEFQMANPFRIIIKLTITPILILLFLGHIVSIGLISDRMPGIPQILSTVIAIISEAFEDAHYFKGHDKNTRQELNLDELSVPKTLTFWQALKKQLGIQKEYDQQIIQDTKILLKKRLDPEEDSHNHNLDIPTLIVKILASPLYMLAAGWDFFFSKRNQESELCHDAPLSSNVCPSTKWQIEHAVSLIEKYEEQHFKGVVIEAKLVVAKKEGLKQLKNELRNPKNDPVAMLANAKNQAVFNQHRLFTPGNEKTSTQIFIEELPERVNLSC